MKYAESAFDILYLLFAVLSGCLMLKRAGSRTGRTMGLAALVLGMGDACHLVPRVLRCFTAADLTAALGAGKLAASVTMTLFYVLLVRIWAGYFRQPERRELTAAVWLLALVRIGLCLLPQNGWLQNAADARWGILRNVPFAVLGAAVCRLYWTRRRDGGALRAMWLYILLSFAFYLPVATAVSFAPWLGMLMLPKTVCYILMIRAFLEAAFREGRG